MIRNFAPGTTHRACVYCGKPVNVTEDSADWNEDVFKPAHRLCANQPHAEETWDEPFRTADILRAWNAAKDEHEGKREPIRPEIKEKIVQRLRECAKSGHRRAKIATRALALIASGRFDGNLFIKRNAIGFGSRLANQRIRHNGCDWSRAGADAESDQAGPDVRHQDPA